MDRNRPKLLIVEDDLSSQQYYTIILEDKFELKIVSTVVEAKKALAEIEYQVCLVDISLPGGEDGFDLIRFIHENFPKNPITIALTAHAFPHTRVEALEAGAVEFYTKPIMSEPLIESIERQIQSLNK